MKGLIGIAVLAFAAVSQSIAISEADARSAAKVAIVEANGSEDKFLKAYERELKKIDKDFGANDGVTILYSEYTQIWARGPATNFGIANSVLVRLMETSRAVEWPRGVTITLLPKRLDTNDFLKIVVSNDGVVVEPEVNDLKPEELTNAFGSKVTRLAGSITFPLSAFKVGTVVTAIPASGTNVVKKISDKDLRNLR